MCDLQAEWEGVRVLQLLTSYLAKLAAKWTPGVLDSFVVS